MSKHPEVVEKPSLSSVFSKIDRIRIAYRRLEGAPNSRLAHEELIEIGHQAALLCKDVAALMATEKAQS